MYGVLLVGKQSPFSRFELLAGILPVKEIARHPAGTYVALEVVQTSPVVGIWETATGALVWTEAGVLAAAWAPDGSELLIVREDQPVGHGDAAADALENASADYIFERRLWPRDALVSSCPLQLPYSGWPVDLWVAPTATLVAVRWMDQGASGWEVVLLRSAGDVHLVGAGFELASEIGIDSHPTLSPDGRYAVVGYQTTYQALPGGRQMPLQHGRFDVGRVVVIDLLAGTYREIVIDDMVPAKLHGTATRWNDAPIFLDARRFELLLPTGAKRIYSVVL